MSRDIEIQRTFPIIDGYVQMPNNLEKDKSSVAFSDAIARLEAEYDYDYEPFTAITGAFGKSNNISGQSWVRLPGIDPSGYYTNKSGVQTNPSDIAKG